MHCLNSFGDNGRNFSMNKQTNTKLVMKNVFKTIVLSLVFMGILSIHAVIGQNQLSSSRSQSQTYDQLVSIELAALRIGTLCLKYERKMDKRMSWTARGGIIGLVTASRLDLGFGSYWSQGKDYSYTAAKYKDYLAQDGNVYKVKSRTVNTVSKDKGFYFRVGPKWMFKARDKFLGFYFQPTALYSQFSYQRYLLRGKMLRDGTYLEAEDNFTHRLTTFKRKSAGALASMGLQLQFAKILVLDINGGLGYVFSFDKGIEESFDGVDGESTVTKVKQNVNFAGVRYTHYSLGTMGGFDNGGLAINLGLSLGIAL